MQMCYTKNIPELMIFIPAQKQSESPTSYPRGYIIPMRVPACTEIVY